MRAVFHREIVGVGGFRISDWLIGRVIAPLLRVSHSFFYGLLVLLIFHLDNYVKRFSKLNTDVLDFFLLPFSFWRANNFRWHFQEAAVVEMVSRCFIPMPW